MLQKRARLPAQPCCSRRGNNSSRPLAQQSNSASPAQESRIYRKSSRPPREEGSRMSSAQESRSPAQESKRIYQPPAQESSRSYSSSRITQESRRQSSKPPLCKLQPNQQQRRPRRWTSNLSFHRRTQSVRSKSLAQPARTATSRIRLRKSVRRTRATCAFFVLCVALALTLAVSVPESA